MNKDLQAQLLEWFSPRQLTAFMGARSDAELQQIVDLMRGYSTQERRSFVRQLAALYRQQHKPRRKTPVFGKLLIDARKRGEM